MPPQPLIARFFKTGLGAEPVREWLLSSTVADRKIIGDDIRTVQIGWPIGMPLVRKLDADLWEVRSHVKDGIARVIFTMYGNTMILLHGFTKKSQKIPAGELTTAKTRLKQFRGDL
ncbi:type II toxin-antitoxin system RelE/ParE family toxin [Cellvibrio sp. pealriver]|uniref:type II toxin-antitoxin system RelE/ParE family toxin n=1 Tax=Cellvibrio sp. pealriver TaxID=1622269 RepID=UPI00066FE2D8|nr:type II toxin-antitoxin system RelE/ParE family toxin [Cellvibrio sp. pealriver]